MKLYHRIICFSLTVILLVSFPFTVMAASAPVTLSTSDYVFSLLLNSCGVEVSLSSISSWLGVWSGYDDYQDKASKGQLGDFSQWLYDRSHTAESEAFRQDALDAINGLNNLQSASFGTTVSIGNTLLPLLKDFLATFESYGTDSTVFRKDYVFPDGYTGTLVSGVPYDNTYVPTGDYNYIFSYCYPPNSSGRVSYTNAYIQGHIVSDIVGVLSGSTASPDLVFYSVNGGKLTSITFRTGSYYVDLDGKTGRSSNYMSKIPSLYLSVPVLQAFPFPVFSTLASAETYASSGVMGSVVNGQTVGLKADAVRPSIKAEPFKVIPGEVTIPSSADVALGMLDRIHSALDADLKQAIRDAGLSIDWGADVVEPTVSPTESAGEGVDTETKTTLAAILTKVEALPATIEALFDNKMEPENVDKDVENMKLPVSISDKFPFCIPFDVAYLVKWIVNIYLDNFFKVSKAIFFRCQIA